MNKINKTRMHKVIAILAVGCGGLFATQVCALPADATNMTVTSGVATYSYNGVAEQGTLTFEQNNSVASFAVEPIKIEATETLNVLPGAMGNSDWVGVIRDDSGMQSELNGTLAAGMRVFFLNSNGMLTGNNFAVDFSGLTNATGSLVLSTHALNVTESDLENGVYRLDPTSPGAAIQLQGLQVTGPGAEVLVLADQLAIDGAVDVAAGQFHGVSAGAVDVTFGVTDMIAVQGAVPLAQGVAGVTTTTASSVSAGHVNLQAWVSDPLMLALNNRGLVEATGISVSDKGTISLVGRGGNLVNTGDLDATDASNGDGAVVLQANIVALGGTVDADRLQIDVGDAQTDGELRVLGSSNVTANSAIVNGLGEINTINGLANYHVELVNEGSAGWLGVASNDWSNSGAVSWNNVSRLIARVDIDNNLQVEDAGRLTNAAGTALLRGGARNDTFTIAGTAQLVEGLGGTDLFIMQGGLVGGLFGGLVEGLVDGGGGIDRIENVYNVELSGPQDINGSSDFVDWVNIQSVRELDVPEPEQQSTQSPNLSGVIASQVSFANVSNMSAASLGLVGAGAEPRLPCGFGSAPISIAGENLAHEEPCMQDYSGPEFQELISSLIHFDHDSFAITPASAARLEKVAGFFVESNAFEKVVIAGHTDDVGSEVYNLALSERRAGSTSRYMQAQGLRPDMIETFHFGEVLPAVPNNSAANRAHNRRARIELK